MKARGNKILGLAIGERSILIAEVTKTADGHQVTHTGSMGYTEGFTLAQPEALGESLRLYLKQEGFTAKDAVFGIPAKWVLTKTKDVPPIDPSLAPDMLRLQVETEFSAEIKDLVHDFAGEVSAAEASQVMLAATPQRHIEQVTAIAEGAKLDVLAITPTTIVLSAATTAGASGGLVLSITPSGTELAAQRGATPSLLRHLGAGVAVTANVAGEVRRAALLLPRNGTAGGNGSSNGNGHIVVWNDASADPDSRRAATDALGSGARCGEIHALGAGTLPGGLPECAAAVALAVAGLSGQPLSLDFHRSRLAPPKKAALDRRMILAIATGAAILLLIVMSQIDLHRRNTELAAKQDELVRGTRTRTDAESEVAKIEYAQNWRAVPRYLDCLRDLTAAFPPDGIYATSFSLHDTMKGELGGKCTGSEKNVLENNVLALKERIRADKKHFQDVNLQWDKKQIKAGQEISFSISFRYIPAQPAQP